MFCMSPSSGFDYSKVQGEDFLDFLESTQVHGEDCSTHGCWGVKIKYERSKVHI